MGFLEQFSTVYLLSSLLLVYSLVLSGVIIIFARRLSRYTRRYEELIEGVNATDIETLINEHIRKNRQLEKIQGEHSDRIGSLERWSDVPFQKLGFLRYNPFGDTGSDQSFSLAILDKNDNGVILTSLRSREGTQIYAKEIKAGEAPEHKLSKEELKVLKEAINQRAEE